MPFGGHSPKLKRHHSDMENSSNVDNDEITSGRTDVNDISNDVLYQVLMKNNEQLIELGKMFQFQFNENNLLKADLAELKTSYGDVLSELKQLKTNYASSMNGNVSAINNKNKKKKNIVNDAIGCPNPITASVDVVETPNNAKKENKRASYSQVTKGTHPVIIIKPKDSS